MITKVFVVQEIITILSGTCFHREIWSGGKKEIDIYGQESQEQLYLFSSHDRALYREANGREQGLYFNW